MPQKINTETGKATLNANGSMSLDNSGYKQTLSPEHVKLVWGGATTLPPSADVMADIESDYCPEEDADDYESAVEACSPSYDGQYWDFGEELHIIPSEAEFAA